jgi:hypothetical protein
MTGSGEFGFPAPFLLHDSYQLPTPPNPMTRRRMLSLSTALLPLGCGLEKKPPAHHQRKKGLCLSTKNRSPRKIARFIQSVGAHWLYNWNIDPPEHHAKAIAFAPMIYRIHPDLETRLAELKANASARGFREILGFNEPDAKTQGNTTVQAALDAWPKLETTGLRLGSPATVHPDNDWMMAFMEGADRRKLRVDFICMHSYGGPGVQSLIRKVETVHALFKRPIWITEFAVADWKAGKTGKNRFTSERVAAFVRELIPQLEAMDIVERYAWFHGGVSGVSLSCSKLFNPDGTLTVVGEAYRSAA